MFTKQELEKKNGIGRECHGKVMGKVRRGTDNVKILLHSHIIIYNYTSLQMHIHT